MDELRNEEQREEQREERDLEQPTVSDGADEKSVRPTEGEKEAANPEVGEERASFPVQAEENPEEEASPEIDTEEAVFTNDMDAEAGETVIRKPSWYRLKKSSVFALVIICMLLGGAISGFGTYYWMNNLEEEPTKVESPDMVTIPLSAFTEYTALSDKYARMEYLFDYIEKNYYKPVNEEDLMNGALHGLVEGLNDPYSEYLTTNEYDTLMQSYDGEFYGIGVSVQNRDGVIYVVSPIDDTPAQRAGVRAGDVITMVDGVAYSGDELDEAVNHMRGEAGKSVEVTIRRDGVETTYTFLREIIKVDTVKSKMLDGNIGYIRISEFEDNTGKEFETALKEMEKAKVKGLVLDLRSNPGGLVDQAIIVADAFLEENVVVYLEDQAGQRGYYSTTNGSTDIPVVFLCDEGTASASEILLAAMKDYGVGTIVGNTTFGKGIIQEMGAHFMDGAGLKLTILEYFSPNGNTIHEVGITPDIKLDYKDNLDESDYDDSGYLKYESDVQLKKAVELLTK